MKQTILRNFIDEQTVTTLLDNILNINYSGRGEDIPRWVYINRTIDEKTSLPLRQLSELIPVKLQELENMQVRVEKITRGVMFTPSVYPIFNQVTEDTSYILFISTGPFTYQTLPVISSNTLYESSGEIIPFPVSMSTGDAFLTEYNDFIKMDQPGIYSQDMTHFCTVYLEPKELWP